MTTERATPASTTAVVGLGPMGSALARALLAAGPPPVVWNRTRSRATDLAAEGAVSASDLSDAVASADLVISCLRDHATTRSVLATVPHETLRGRTVVILASATPDEARATHAWAVARGLTVLVGSIMVPVPLVGTPEAQILYAGDPALVERHRDVLERLAGRTDHVGEDPGHASLLDTAMLEVYFAGMTAFLHGAAMAAREGIDATTFAAYARDVLALLPDTVDGLAADVDAGRHPGHEDTIAMELAALEHMVATSEATGVDPSLPVLMRRLAHDAVAAGHGGDSWSRVVDVLRGTVRTPAA
ncbi:3-hydroxyisobutyrate dehydrogenase-like beta-hydroxyacid dehydrogenase [Isoptericola sp. CG 20/1183]|uniref:3-hydroxyisobutyrate dehydrogenase-like beta-hydroxyacid dehydrogenase n=1 Tax=Isoptericola halotolerans TaxID=300560 RepID=A0ABX5EIT2_9MICO|nr:MULTISPECIES: NAD(P)-binding domain-containing protein [Isoptericola]PRZ08135.1 3-hydroxyisobutyrate dehydrogenase-like beta-hydroxyacid dehydrogenase [Isoptericola halotolerans]PRZ08932.1 3-hydroxyisobutyrate dehydrogenase-like beta-hydroxyacid dehydrogenase [Isoptericola sp. CG 20/1183]